MITQPIYDKKVNYKASSSSIFDGTSTTKKTALQALRDLQNFVRNIVKPNSKQCDTTNNSKSLLRNFIFVDPPTTSTTKKIALRALQALPNFVRNIIKKSKDIPYSAVDNHKTGTLSTWQTIKKFFQRE